MKSYVSQDDKAPVSYPCLMEKGGALAIAVSLTRGYVIHDPVTKMPLAEICVGDPPIPWHSVGWGPVPKGEKRTVTFEN